MPVGQGIGLPVDRQAIDEMMSQIALELRQITARLTLDALPWSAGTPQEDLEAGGGLDPPYTTEQAYLIKATLDRLNDVLALLQGGDPAVVLPTGEAGRWPHDLFADLAQMKGLAGQA
jgi:hypothetical protein